MYKTLIPKTINQDRKKSQTKQMKIHDFHEWKTQPIIIKMSVHPNLVYTFNEF